LNLLQRVALVVVIVVVAIVLTLILIQPDLISRLDSGVRVFLALLIDLTMLGLLAALLRRQRVPNQSALMVRAAGAVADVNVASARERILRAVRAVPGVTSVEAKVEAVRSRADIELDVMVSGTNINVPHKQKEIDRALRQVIQKQLGLQMARKPRVHIQLEAEQPEVPATRIEKPRPAIAPPPVVTEALPASVSAPLPSGMETNADTHEEPNFVGERTSVASPRLYDPVLPRVSDVGGGKPDPDDETVAQGRHNAPNDLSQEDRQMPDSDTRTGR
jgi:hypothetical protein